MGRKSKLTSELTSKICDLIGRGGMTVEKACVAAGIGETTYYAWFNRGEADKSGPYREFWEAVKKAAVEFERTHLDIIRRAAQESTTERRTTVRTTSRGETVQEVIEISKPPTWTASAWLLERTRPDQYSRKYRTVEVELPLPDPRNVTGTAIDADDDENRERFDRALGIA